VVASAFGTGARAATAAAVRARANKSILRIASSIREEGIHCPQLIMVRCADARGQGERRRANCAPPAQRAGRAEPGDEAAGRFPGSREAHASAA